MDDIFEVDTRYFKVIRKIIVDKLFIEIENCKNQKDKVSFYNCLISLSGYAPEVQVVMQQNQQTNINQNNDLNQPLTPEMLEHIKDVTNDKEGSTK